MIEQVLTNSPITFFAFSILCFKKIFVAAAKLELK